MSIIRKNQSIIFFFIALVLAFIPLFDILIPYIGKNYIVQDDARQAVIFYMDFWDPSAFGPHNDFFTRIPKEIVHNKMLLKWVYKLLSLVTDNIVFASKILALILSILSSICAYFYIKKIFSRSTIALSFVLVLSTVLWCGDDLSSGTNRSFTWSLFFLYLYLRHLNKQFFITIIQVFSLFMYPCLYLSLMFCDFYALIFAFFEAKSKKIKSLVEENKKLLFSMLVASVPFIIVFVLPVMFPELFPSKVDTLTVDEMKRLPDFNIGGRHPVFGYDIGTLQYWFDEHWGLGIFTPVRKQVVFLGILGFVAYQVLGFFVKKNKKEERELVFLCCASVTTYILAKLLFPLMYYPSRYLMTPVIILSLIYFYKSILMLWELLSEKLNFVNKMKSYFINFTFVVLAIFSYLHFKKFYAPNFHALPPALLDLIKKVPADSLIAIMPNSDYSSTIPITTGREVFIDYERTVYPTLDYIKEVRRRYKEVYSALYSDSLIDVINFAQRNQITHFLIFDTFYKKQYIDNPGYVEPYQTMMQQIARSKKQYVFKNLLEKNNTSILFISLNQLVEIVNHE